VLQIFWLKVGRIIFFRLYQPLKVLNPYEEFSDSNGDSFAQARRDFSYYGQSVNFSGNEILDVGCGSGRKTAFYSTQGGDVIGVDFSRLAIKESHRFVKDRGFRRVDFLVAEAGFLPFRRGSFDVVISNDALEHFRNWRGAVLEIERVVKSGGYMCMNFGPLWLSPFGSHMDFSENFSPPWAHLFFSEENIKEVLISLGKVSETGRDKPLFMHHLNHITVNEFEGILKNTKLNVLFFKLCTVPPFEPLLKTPLREFLTTRVIALLKKGNFIAALPSRHALNDTEEDSSIWTKEGC